MLGGIGGNKNPSQKRMMLKLGGNSKERTSGGLEIGSGLFGQLIDCESREKKGVKVRFLASASEWRVRLVTEMGNGKDSLEKR